MNQIKHIPVLLEEVCRFAFPEWGKVFVDATFGLGGHTNAILKAFPAITSVIAIDQDSEVLRHSLENAPDPRIKRFHANASELPQLLSQNGALKADGILLDLGVSSYQLDCPQRGFSFSSDGPLDMRMNPQNPISAFKVVNEYSIQQLATIIKQYGEETFSRQIAQAIIRARQQKPISSTSELAAIVQNAVPAKARYKSKIHPATKTFQAIRIAVNNELTEIESFLNNVLDCLNIGGHLTLISFHSLEDRIVKSFFKQQQTNCICPPNFPVCTCSKRATLKILTTKPVIASPQEVLANPRARSAKLRSALKLPEQK